MKSMGIGDVHILNLFQTTLRGSAIEWYMRLKPEVKSYWKLLSNAFVENFAYNDKM